MEESVLPPVADILARGRLRRMKAALDAQDAAQDAQDAKELDQFHLEKLPTRLLGKLVLQCQNELDRRNQVFSQPPEAAAPPTKEVNMESKVAPWLPVKTSQPVESPAWFQDLQRNPEKRENQQRPKGTRRSRDTELPPISYRTRETLWEAGTKPENRPPERRVGRMLWYETEFPVVKK